MQPSKYQVTTTVVWIRYTLLTVGILNWIDDHEPHQDVDALASKVDEFSLQMEALIREWDLVMLMQSEDTPNQLRNLLADHISTYTSACRLLEV